VPDSHSRGGTSSERPTDGEVQRSVQRSELVTTRSPATIRLGLQTLLWPGFPQYEASER